MAVSTHVKNSTDGSVAFADGTATPVSKTLDYEDGVFALSGFKKVLNAETAYERRGKLCTVRHTTREYPTISLTAKMTQFTDAANGTMMDFLTAKAGSAYSANVSTLGTGLPYTLDATFTVEGTDFGDSADHTFTCADVLWAIDFSEGDPTPSL